LSFILAFTRPILESNSCLTFNIKKVRKKVEKSSKMGQHLLYSGAGEGRERVEKIRTKVQKKLAQNKFNQHKFVHYLHLAGVHFNIGGPY
jgi:hypothetical protein